MIVIQQGLIDPSSNSGFAEVNKYLSLACFSVAWNEANQDLSSENSKNLKTENRRSPTPQLIPEIQKYDVKMLVLAT